MNRRQFTQTLLASGAAAPLTPALATGAKAAEIKPFAYAWAKTIARVQNGVTPEYLMKQLHIPFDAAAQIQSRLIADGVLRGSVMSGVQAAKPMQTGLKLPKPDLRKAASQVAEKLDEYIDNQLDDDQSVTENDISAGISN